MPALTKARLQLDHERSWVITKEVNIFTWPGPDLRLVDRTAPSKGVAYGYLPEKTTLEIEADVILPMLGFVSDLGPLGGWGLTLEKEEIVVNSMMETGRPGIYAAGDITTYPGKLKLIASGFAEAATAVNQAVHWIYPEKKVAPGHSSNMSIFGQTDD